MRNVRNLYRSIPSLLIAVFLLSSCVVDENYYGPNIGPEEDVTILLQLPSTLNNSSTGTRAIADDKVADNRIDAISILLFNKDNDKIIHYYYATNITNVANQENKKIIKTRLPKGEYKIALAANYHDSVRVYATKPDATLSSIVNSCYFILTPYGTKWNSNPESNGFLPFPMWGEVSGTVNITGSGNLTLNVTLHRMMAKINLAVKYTEANNFVLEEINVYHYNRRGYLAPIENGKIHDYKSRQTADNFKPLLYDNNFIVNSTETNQWLCSDEIFVFESGIYEPDKDNFCLVIGGTYKGQKGYYRIDMIDNLNNRMEIMRNTKYNITVEEIKTFGYDTPEEARVNKPENLTVDITVWKESNISIVGNGQYYMAFNTRDLYFNQIPHPNTQLVIIETNTPSLAISQTTGDSRNFKSSLALTSTAGEVKTYTLTVEANSNTGNSPERYAEVMLKGANISAPVKIKQDASLQFLLKCTNLDPTKQIDINENAQRIRVDLLSTHNYTYSLSHINEYTMLTGVYSAETGGTRYDSGTEIPASVRTIWVDVSKQTSGYSKTGFIEFKHVASSNSTAPPVKLSIFQSRLFIEAVVREGGSTATINSRGGIVNIYVHSNLTAWFAKLWINNNPVSDADLDTYLSATTGSNGGTVKLSVSDSGLERVFKLVFQSLDGTIVSDPAIVVKQVVYYGGSSRITWKAYNASDPECTGWNATEKGRYVLTEDPRDGGLFFKFGSVIGVYSGYKSVLNLTQAEITGTNRNVDLINELNEDIPHKLGQPIKNWSNIPYTAGPLPLHSKDLVKAGKGDPCRLVGLNLDSIVDTPTSNLTTQNIDNGKWRLPSMNRADDNYNYEKFTGIINNSVITDVHWWTSYSSFSGVPGGEFPNARSNNGSFLPALGYRDFDGTLGATNAVQGQLKSQGVKAVYWSSQNNPSSTENARILSFEKEEISTKKISDMRTALPVRCVPQR